MRLARLWHCAIVRRLDTSKGVTSESKVDDLNRSGPPLVRSTFYYPLPESIPRYLRSSGRKQILCCHAERQMSDPIKGEEPTAAPAAAPAAAVADAYEKYWDSAVDYSLAEVKRRVPGVESVFLLRAVPTEGKYRPINGDAIIVNDAGQARAPWREAGHDSPIAAEISSMSFEQVVEAVSVPTR